MKLIAFFLYLSTMGLLYANPEVQKIEDVTNEISLDTTPNHSWYITFESVNIEDATKGSLENQADRMSWTKIQVPSNAYNYLPEHIKKEKGLHLSHGNYLKAIFTFSEPEAKAIYLYYKKEIYLPKNIPKNLAVRLGRITDRDEAYFNGHLIGQTGIFNHPKPQAYDKFRIYEIKSNILKPNQKNVIIIKAQNYITYEMGILGDYTSIGGQSQVISNYYQTEILKLIFLVIYLTSGTYFLFLFLRKVKDYSYLSFGIFSLILITYLFFRTQIKYEIFEDFYIIKKTEYLVLVCLFPSITHFTRIFFNYAYSLFLKTLDSILFFTFLIFLLHPSLRIHNYINYYFLQYVMLIYISMAGYYLIQKIIQKDKDAMSVSFGGSVIIIFGIIDIISTAWVLNLPKVSTFGFIILQFNLIGILANRYVKLNRDNEELFIISDEEAKKLSCLYNISLIFSGKQKPKAQIYHEVTEVIGYFWPYYTEQIEVKLELDGLIYKNRAILFKGESLHTTIQHNEKTLGYLGVKYSIRLEKKDKYHYIQKSMEFLSAISGLLGNLISKIKADEGIIVANTIFENAIEGVMITDINGTIQYVNQAFTTTTGYLPGEVLGQKPNILKSGHHEPEFFKNLWDSILTKGKWYGEIWNRRKNGEAFPELLSISSISNPNGEIVQFAAVYFDISDIKRSEEKIRYQAYHDALTGLANRTLFYDRLNNSILQAKMQNYIIGILFIDLDNFKQVNDTLGHNAGDQFIKSVAKQIKQSVKEADTVARLSGDEFIVLVNGCNSKEEVIQLANQILSRLQYPTTIQDHDFQISASIGISFFPDDGTDMESLIKHADLAMYQAKEKGKNTYQIFTYQMKETAYRKFYIENELRKSISHDELSLVFQPIVSIPEKQIVAIETLLRWDNGNLGKVPPSEFIPIAENSEIIIKLGEWVLANACLDTIGFHKKGLDNLFVSVNVSAKQFTNKKFISTVEEILEKTLLPPSMLILEVTESIVMTNIEQAIQTMKTLTDIGISFSIDDFGTGYSSLSYLKKFPISKLKIDRSFIIDITKDKEDRQIVKATIDLGHNLGLKVIAEGVETKEQLQFLIDEGCDEIQGYFFSPPLAKSSFLNFYKDFGKLKL
ncbi:MAG: EAL domain-containing protein [Leptospiraceae bacterium]|nr:EAL domain-containing protein [Leptospiraceae bacterium]